MTLLLWVWFALGPLAHQQQVRGKKYLVSGRRAKIFEYSLEHVTAEARPVAVSPMQRW